MGIAPSRGSTAARVTRRKTSLPWFRLSLVCSLLFVDSTYASVVYTFAPFLISGFGYSLSEVGYYTGLLNSALALGEFLGSFFWGYLSDRKEVGRKIVLLIGCGSGATCLLLFGVSWHLAWVMLMRFIGGLLDCNWPIAKAYVFDITDDTNRPEAYSALMFVFGCGSVTGSLLGGFLARPSQQYPDVFGHQSFWTRYPYFLPCLICATLGYAALVINFFFLRESHPEHASNLANKSTATTTAVTADAAAATASTSTVSTSAAPFISDLTPVSSNDTQLNSVGQKSSGRSSEDNSSVSTHTSAVSNPKPQHAFTKEELIEAGVDERQNIEAPRDGSTIRYTIYGDRVAPPPLPPHPLAAAWALLKRRPVRFVVFGYALALFVSPTLADVFPVWAVNPPRDPNGHGGGLGFSTRQLGIYAAVSGAVLATFQLLAYSLTDRSIGTLWCYRLGTLLWATAVIVLPWLRYAAERSSVGLWVALAGCLVVQQSGESLMFTSVNILANSLVANEQAIAGRLNGLTNAVAGLGNAIGPAAGSALFAWSFRSSGLPFPLDYHLVFLILAAIVLIAHSLSWTVRYLDFVLRPSLVRRASLRRLSRRLSSTNLSKDAAGGGHKAADGNAAGGSGGNGAAPGGAAADSSGRATGGSSTAAHSDHSDTGTSTSTRSSRSASEEVAVGPRRPRVLDAPPETPGRAPSRDLVDPAHRNEIDEEGGLGATRGPLRLLSISHGPGSLSSTATPRSDAAARDPELSGSRRGLSVGRQRSISTHDTQHEAEL